MEVTKLTALMRGAACPKGCGKKQIMLGIYPQQMKPGTTPLEWLRSGDTGISSQTIYAAMTGAAVKHIGWPHDADDFGRCYRLLRLFPEWRADLERVTQLSPPWHPFVDAWGNLTNLFEQFCDDVGRPRSSTNRLAAEQFSLTIRELDRRAEKLAAAGRAA